MRSVCALLAMLFGLAGCSGPSGPPAPPPPGAQTINPMEYLIESRNPDGNTSTPLHQADRLTYRRQDFGGFQDEDAFLLRDGSAILTWSYPPFGPFDARHGDGGERYIIDGHTVRIDSTQDGGKPGVQYFTGAACGGTGWVAFRDDADASWKQLTASLSNRPNPSACATRASSLTRYTRQTVNFPKLGALPTVIGEHYNTGDLNSASALERSFWAKGWGRLVWQAFRKPAPHNVDPNLPKRCPDFGYNSLPGWTLVDCRVAVNVVPAADLTGAQEWQP